MLGVGHNTRQDNDNDDDGHDRLLQFCPAVSVFMGMACDKRNTHITGYWDQAAGLPLYQGS